MNGPQFNTTPFARSLAAYPFEGGTPESSALTNKGRCTRRPVHQGHEDNVEVEVALQWNDSFTEQVFPYTNNVHNKDGGTHLTGFRAALTKTVNTYGAKLGSMLKDLKQGLSGEDVREGLTAVLNIKHPDPSFDSQTKSKLVSSEVKGIVEQVVNDRLGQYLEENPESAHKIVEKAVVAAPSARSGAQGARDGSAQGRSTSAACGQLADCQRKIPRRADLIVEGDSAGGSASRGAIVSSKPSCRYAGKDPERGARPLDKCWQEVATLITALGAGIGGEKDLEKLRYHRIIIMTDADVDGSHIRTLLLTFFYRQMTEVIRRGYLYIAQPPLYKLAKGKKERFLKDDDMLAGHLLDLGTEGLQVRSESRGQELMAAPLRALLEELWIFRQILRKLQRRCDSNVLAALVRAAKLDADGLSDRARVEAAIASVRASMAITHPDVGIEGKVLEDAEHSRFKLSFAVRAGVATRSFVVGHELLSESDYVRLLQIEQTIEATLGPKPFWPPRSVDGERCGWRADASMLTSMRAPARACTSSATRAWAR